MFVNSLLRVYTGPSAEIHHSKWFLMFPGATVEPGHVVTWLVLRVYRTEHQCLSLWEASPALRPAHHPDHLPSRDVLAGLLFGALSAFSVSARRPQPPGAERASHVPSVSPAHGMPPELL